MPQLDPDQRSSVWSVIDPNLNAPLGAMLVEDPFRGMEEGQKAFG